MLDKDIENITLGALLTPPHPLTSPQLEDKAVASNSEISFACIANGWYLLVDGGWQLAEG